MTVAEADALAELHEEIAAGVDRVCTDFDDAYWSERDAAHEFPWDFYEAMAAGGWVGIAIPEAYGGGGQGIAEAAIVLERVAASGAGMNGSSSLHLTVFGLNPVVKFGSEALKAHIKLIKYRSLIWIVCKAFCHH